MLGVAHFYDKHKKAAADGELERVKQKASNGLHLSVSGGEAVWERVTWPGYIPQCVRMGVCVGPTSYNICK